MAIFQNAERDAADLAKLVNEDTDVTTRYGTNPKKSAPKAIREIGEAGDAVINNFNDAGDAAITAKKADFDSAIASKENEFDQVIDQYKESRGFNTKGTFADGFTYELPNDVGLDADGNPWVYNGTLPFTVTAGTAPTSPNYTQVAYGTAAQVSTNTSDTVQSFVDSFALKIFQSPTDGGLTEIQTRTVNASEVYEVRKTSDNSLATIYSDAAGTTEITQNGTDNKSGSDGVVKFYIADGDYYVEVDGVKSKFITAAWQAWRELGDSRGWGIIGLGDETELVRDFHSYCNEKNITCSYNGVESINIQSDAQILVNTSVNFGAVKFNYLNGMNENPDFTSFNVSFLIYDASYPVIDVTANTIQSELYRDATAIPSLSVYSDSLLIIDSNIPWFGKSSGFDSRKQSTGWLFSDGVLQFPIGRDYTSGDLGSVKVRGSGAAIEIKGGYFDLSNTNNQVVFKCERNKVNFESNKMISSTPIDYDNTMSCLWLNECGDINVNNRTSQAFSQAGGGSDSSYSFYGLWNANVRFFNDKADGGTWGSHGTTWMNGLFYNNCDVNRIDVHFGGFNLYANNSRIGNEGVAMGEGGGVLSIKGCTISKGKQGGGGYADFFGKMAVIRSRANWASWFDGVMDVQDCVVNIDPSIPELSTGTYNAPVEIPLIDFRNMTGDFIERTTIANKINIRNVTYKSSEEVYNDYFVTIVGVRMIGLKMPSKFKVPDITVDNLGWEMQAVNGLVCPASLPVETGFFEQDINCNGLSGVNNCHWVFSNIQNGAGRPIVEFSTTRSVMSVLVSALKSSIDAEIANDVNVLTPKIEINNCTRLSFNVSYPCSVSIVGGSIAYAKGKNGNTDARFANSYIKAYGVEIAPVCSGILKDGNSFVDNLMIYNCHILPTDGSSFARMDETDLVIGTTLSPDVNFGLAAGDTFAWSMASSSDFFFGKVLLTDRFTPV